MDFLVFSSEELEALPATEQALLQLVNTAIMRWRRERAKETQLYHVKEVGVAGPGVTPYEEGFAEGVLRCAGFVQDCGLPVDGEALRAVRNAMMLEVMNSLKDQKC